MVYPLISSNGINLGQTLQCQCPHFGVLGLDWKVVIPGRRVLIGLGGSPGVMAFTRCWEE